MADSSSPEALLPRHNMPSRRISLDGVTIQGSPRPGTSSSGSPSSPRGFSRMSSGSATPGHYLPPGLLNPPIQERGLRLEPEPQKTGGADYGWPQLAQLMTEQPVLRCFSRFEPLNVKTLLYYQVEMALLQDELERQERKDIDAKDNDDGDDFAGKPDYMVPETTGKKSAPGTQWKIIMRIRQTMTEYNRFLLEYSKVSQLPSATDVDANAVATWMTWSHPTCGRDKLSGGARNIWPKKEEKGKATSRPRLLFNLVKSMVGRGENSPTPLPGLVSLYPPEDCDKMSLWIRDEWTTFRRSFRGQIPKSAADDSGSPADVEPVETEKDATNTGNEFDVTEPKWILKVTSAVTFMLSCIFPVGGIAILASLDSFQLRIGCIAVFTFIVAGTLLIITDCTRKDIFMATAAFTAVLVVFVGRN